jgi:hypothetical protein
MNTDALLALIADLYAQLLAAQQEIARLNTEKDPS